VGRASPALVGFSAGEFAPQMEGRIDVEKYGVAAHIAQNFLILKQGPAQFRSGTAFAQATRNSANRSWLRRFEFSQTQAFILEFGDKYVRFYTNHGPLLAIGVAAWNAATAYVLGNLVTYLGVTYYCQIPNTNVAPPNSNWYTLTNYTGPGGGAIYEIPSPYAAADLTDSLGEFTLQFEQSADVLYIAGGAAGAGPSGVGYPTYTLIRYANAPPNWQFAQYAPVDGPYADQAPLTPGAVITLGVTAAPVGGSTIIQAYGGNVFAPTDIGRLVRIDSALFNVTPWATQTAFATGNACTNNGNNYVALNNATTGGSPPVHTAGSALDGPSGVRWLYTDSGYGVAQITSYTSPTQVGATVLMRFPANVVAAQAAITGISQANPAVVTAANTFTQGESLFIYGVQGMTQVNQNPYYSNQTANAANATLAGIDSTTFGAWSSGGFIVGNSSWEWQLGAWSNTTEWPRCLAIFKDRLCLRGRLKLWGSVVGLYNSHAPDTFGIQTTASAINIFVQGSDASFPSWLSAALLLLDGGQGGEYGIDAANFSTSPLGPANVEALRQSNWRCRPIQPVIYGTTVLYVQRAGRKLFAMDYTLWLNRYDSTDQSKYAYHISVGGITAIASQQEPYAIIWAVRSDGTLLSYTFNREDSVTAWARHNLGGNGQVESIAVIPSPDGLRDELWMIVNRTVNGAVTRTVEYLTKPFEGPQGGNPGDSQSSCWYVDCGVQYIAPQPVPITNVSVTTSFNRGIPVTTITYLAANSFTAGQQVSVSGVKGSGTLNPNGAFTISSVSPTQFTVVLLGEWYSFAYTSGGTASANAPSTGTTTITGIPAVLWNQTVNILADGAKQPQQQVSATGTLTLVGTFNTVTLGFPYQGNLVPMRPEAQAVGVVGTSQGKLKKGSQLVLRLVDTLGGIVGQLSDTNPVTGVYANPLGQHTLTLAKSEPIVLNKTSTPLDSPPPIQSGDFRVDFASGANSDSDERDLYMLVQQNDPLPMTVVGIFPSYSVSDPQ
jgi:hypothetical protein